MFETPIAQRKVRKDVWAYKYRNGTINIAGMKYIYYSFAEAIMRWRKKNPIRKSVH